MHQMKLNKTELSIGVVATRTGISVAAIRYYEAIGLISPASRRASGHRAYGSNAQKSLQWIKKLRSLGFSIDKIRELSKGVAKSEGPEESVLAVAQTHLEELRSQLGELRAFEQRLAAAIRTCTVTCIGGLASQCTIVGDLAAWGATTKPTCCNKAARS
jgi:DNA-binding transcriptional MerR regulator